MIDLITSLPAALITVILSTWVDVDEVCCVDSAYCNHIDRPAFLALIKSPLFVASNPVDVTWDAIDWLLLREMRTSRLLISSLRNTPEVSKYFRFTGPFVKYVNIEETIQSWGVMCIAMHCHNLKSVTIRGNVGLMDGEFFELLSNNPNVHELDLDHCELNSCTLEHLQLPQLHRLNIIRSPLCAELIDVIQISFASHIVKLDFHLSWLEFDAENSFQTLLGSMQHLRALCVRHCEWVDDEIVNAIATHCKGLVHLDLYCCKNITDASVTNIARNLTQLRTIDIRGCELLTILSFQSMSQYTVSRLELFYFDLKSGHYMLTAMLKKGIHLRDVCISCGQSILDMHIGKIVSSLLSVRRLHMFGCLVNDEALLAMVKHCTQLSELYLSEQSGKLRCTPVGLLYVSQRCLTLRILGLSDFNTYEKMSLFLWRALCPHLKVVPLGKAIIYDALAQPL